MFEHPVSTTMKAASKPQIEKRRVIQLLPYSESIHESSSGAFGTRTGSLVDLSRLSPSFIEGSTDAMLDR
jgi:hypothetical protein